MDCTTIVSASATEAHTKKLYSTDANRSEITATRRAGFGGANRLVATPEPMAATTMLATTACAIGSTRAIRKPKALSTDSAAIAASEGRAAHQTNTRSAHHAR